MNFRGFSDDLEIRAVSKPNKNAEEIFRAYNIKIEEKTSDNEEPDITVPIIEMQCDDSDEQKNSTENIIIKEEEIDFVEKDSDLIENGDKEGTSVKKEFYEKLNETLKKCYVRSAYFSNERYNQIIREVKQAKSLKETKQPLSSKQERRLKRFDVVTIAGSEKLIEKPKGNSTEPIRYYCKTDDLFNVIQAAHIATGHKRIRVMEATLSKTYCNVTRTAIKIYLALCGKCKGRNKNKSKGITLAPLVPSDAKSKCLVNIIDKQNEPDRDYRFILIYEEFETKFTILRPIKIKTPNEVADTINNIFCTIGAPGTIQMNSDHEFAEEVVQILVESWPGLKLSNVKPVGRSERNFRDILQTWMLRHKNGQWAERLKFLQWSINTALHEEINRTPFEAMFGSSRRFGIVELSEKQEPEFVNIKTERVEYACSVCDNTGGLETCSECKEKVHQNCASKINGCVVCTVCSKNVIQVGQNVVVEIPSVEKGITLPKNVLAVVLSVHEGGLYKLGTKTGELPKLYDRSEFAVSGCNFMEVSDVPGTSVHSSNLKEVVNCQCKRYCISKKCNCRLKNRKCGSKCHNNIKCKNQ